MPRQGRDRVLLFPPQARAVRSGETPSRPTRCRRSRPPPSRPAPAPREPLSPSFRIRARPTNRGRWRPGSQKVALPLACDVVPLSRRQHVAAARHLGDRDVPPRVVARHTRLALDGDDDDGWPLLRAGLGERVADRFQRLGAPDSRAKRFGVGGKVYGKYVAVEVAGRGVAIAIRCSEAATADSFRKAADAREP